MKKIYYLFAVLFSCVVFGQIVNIPDANFKAKLVSSTASGSNAFAINSSGNYVKIDSNSNGEIEVSEALDVVNLNLSVSLIYDLTGLQSFSNLEYVKIFGVKANTIDFSGMTHLFQIDLQTGDYVSSINIDNCTSLENLKVAGTSMASITLDSNSLKNLTFFGGNFFNQLNILGCTALQNLSIQASHLTSLNLANMTTLKNIDLLSNNVLSNLSLQGCTSLYYIRLAGSAISNLNLSNYPLLWRVEINTNNSLHTLNFSNCPSLERITATSNPNLVSLGLNNVPEVLMMDLFSNKFSQLDLSAVGKLSYLRCKNNLLTALNLSQNPLLGQLDCEANNLQYINLKSGGQNFPTLSLSNNPQLQFICCDSEDTATVYAWLGPMGANINVNSYCSFTPGGTFYTIQGETKYDVTNNGCDSADPKKALQKFNISGTSGTGSLIGDGTGQFSLPVQAGSHTLTPFLENPSYFNISPASFTANFPTMTSPLNQNFCMTANGNHDDLEIVMIPVNSARPGFVSEYKVLFKNKGTATQAGSFSFNYDDNLMNFLSTSLATSAQSFGVLNYQFTNLLPFQTRELTVKFTLNTPTQTPPLIGGAVLNYTAQINGATDETPLDNTFTLNQTVVNSFDPNDKTCLEGTAISQTKVGDYVHYLIRFENTGTANAENIVVKDMIDTSKYDINSLVALNGSHSFVTRITNPNTVEFIFENIQLPFNDLYNDGYVSFKIKTKSTLVLGDSFSNTANIFFDYNAPIVTNTAITTVAQILGTQENTLENSLVFYPNPVEDVIHFKTDEKLLKAEIYDISGRIVGSVKIQNSTAHLGFLKTGKYLIKTFTKDNSYVNAILKN